MTDETLVQVVKEVGKQFFDLEKQARARGFEVRMVQHYNLGDVTTEVQVFKKL